MKNDEGCKMYDEGCKMNDDDFKLLKGFLGLTDEQMNKRHLRL